MSTPGPDVVIAAFRVLAVPEQERVLAALIELRAQRLAGDDSLAARMIRSMVRVAEEVGRTPTIQDYRATQPRLTAAGEDIETFKTVYGFFDGAWARATEAFDLAAMTTPKMIEARFRSRRAGKVSRYSEETLRETLAKCVVSYGWVPSVSEFEDWRERELELARERGDNTLQLPSPPPYRRRWGSWHGALRHFGHDPKSVAVYRG